MNEEEKELEEASEASKEKKESSGKGLKIGLIIVGVVALLQVVVLVVIFSDQVYNVFENIGSSSDEPEIVFTYPLETIQVNLTSTSSSRNNFLRTTIHLAYEDESHTEVIDHNLIQIQALLNEILRSQTIDDIDTVEKTQELSEKIQSNVNELLGLDIVTSIYFVEFLWQ